MYLPWWRRDAPQFHKIALQWLGKSYRVYLWDTHKVNELHNIALKGLAKNAVELIEFIQNSKSDQMLDKDTPELGENVQGD